MILIHAWRSKNRENAEVAVLVKNEVRFYMLRFSDVRYRNSSALVLYISELGVGVCLQGQMR